MFRFISYLRFLLKSTNEHGIHSPFVFDLVTKCLYKKPQKAKQKTLDVLLKSIEYFEVKNVVVFSDPAVEGIIKKEYPEVSFSKEPKDLVFFNAVPNGTFSELLGQVHNDSVILFKNIYSSAEEFRKWSELTEHEKITVSIDFYYCGLVFIRREQVKQHFYIRI